MAAIPANYSTGVFTNDIKIDELLAAGDVLAQYVIEEQWATNAFVQSGILATDSRLNNTTGVRVLLPFFNELEAEEEQVRSDSSWGKGGGGFFTPQKTAASNQVATITHRGLSYAADDLSQVQTGQDALAVIRSQMASELNRFLSNKLLSQLSGLFGTALAGNTYDATSSGATAYMSAANLTSAKYILGNRAQTLRAMVVHPDVAGDLEILGMQTMSGSPGGTVQYQSNGIGVTNPEIRTFAGLNVIVDDTVPVDGTPGSADAVYTSYLFAPGVVRTGSQYPLNIQADRNKLSLQDIIIYNYSNVLHVLGTSWGNQDDNPLNNDPGGDGTQGTNFLDVAGNWSCVYTGPNAQKKVPLMQMQTKVERFQ